MPVNGYYENPWVYYARQSVSPNDLQTFVANCLIFFDNTVPERDSADEKIFVKLTRMWRSLQNLVFLPLDASAPEDFRSRGTGLSKPQVVYDGDPLVKILYFDANTLRLETRLNRPRFLLWTNGYNPGWHVYIDGHEGRLLRADYAFKGAWVPAGDHNVVFRFGTPLQYGMAYVLMFAFFALLAAVLALGIREGFLVEKEVAFGS
jgi:hypothetical protein